MGKHSKYGASSAYRWVPCPGSVTAIAKAISEGLIPANNNTAASLEGTCAHWVLEMSIKYNKKPKAFLNLEHAGVRITSEMVGYIQEVLDWVYKQVPKGGIIITEKRYTNLRRMYGLDVGGTVDITILAPGVLIILDLKYGKVYVHHENNIQLNIYTLSAIYKYMRKYKIKRIKQGIMQPRAFNEAGTNRITNAFTPSKIMRWERRVLIPVVDVLKTDEHPIIPGDHCEWCPVGPRTGICAKSGQHLIEVAQTDFAALAQPRHQLPNPSDLTFDQLATVVTHEGQFTKFLKGCKERVNQLMIDGSMSHEDLKIVAKNKSTSYTEQEKKIIARLKRRKVPEHLYLTQQKLLSHGILKTNLTGHWGNKVKANKFISDVTATNDNGYTVALSSDPKKEAHVTPQKEFEHVAQSRRSNARRRRAKR